MRLFYGDTRHDISFIIMQPKSWSIRAESLDVSLVIIHFDRDRHMHHVFVSLCWRYKTQWVEFCYIWNVFSSSGGLPTTYIWWHRLPSYLRKKNIGMWSLFTTHCISCLNIFILFIVPEKAPKKAELVSHILGTNWGLKLGNLKKFAIIFHLYITNSTVTLCEQNSKAKSTS